MNRRSIFKILVGIAILPSLLLRKVSKKTQQILSKTKRDLDDSYVDEILYWAAEGFEVLGRTHNVFIRIDNADDFNTTLLYKLKYRGNHKWSLKKIYRSNSDEYFHELENIDSSATYDTKWVLEHNPISLDILPKGKL